MRLFKAPLNPRNSQLAKRVMAEAQLGAGGLDVHFRGPALFQHPDIEHITNGELYEALSSMELELSHQNVFQVCLNYWNSIRRYV